MYDSDRKVGMRQKQRDMRLVLFGITLSRGHIIRFQNLLFPYQLLLVDTVLYYAYSVHVGSMNHTLSTALSDN